MKDPRLLLPLILLPPALAGDYGSDFGTINLLGQHSEHERITRAALACQGSWPSDGSCFEPLSIDQLAGKNGTFGAVGAPDVPMPFGAEAHCDDADFLAVENYPQTRREASAKLEACVGYLRDSFKEGIDDAEDLLDGGGEVKSFLFYDFGNKVLDTGCAFRPTAPLKTLHKGRAKCNVLQGLGIAIHGVQDFYSHSNWADTSSPPYTIANPPGLAQPKISPLLNLRPTTHPPPLDIPHNLTTGCYAVGVEELHGAPAPKGTPCHDRVLHVSLSKDKGLIDKKTGLTSDPGTPRGKRADNFQRAVRLAVEDTRRQWSDFRAELKEKYGERRGERMICVVTRDEPWKEC